MKQNNTFNTTVTEYCHNKRFVKISESPFLPRLDKMRREKRALMQNRAVRTVNWKEISKNASAADPEVQDQPETDKVQSGASGRAVGLG